jgi:hypothetical protein
VIASAFAKKFESLGACKEGVDWCEAMNIQDFRAAYRQCPAPEFMCWSLVRVMGLEGTRAPVACAAAAAQLYADPTKNGDPNLAPALALCTEVIERRSADTRALQVLAYDLSAAGLSSKKGNGSILVSAAYAAYAVVFALKAERATDAAERTKAILKAASHASDAAVQSWEALPNLGPALPQVVREAVREEAALKAWAALSATL